jgi:uncharacterized protein
MSDWKTSRYVTAVEMQHGALLFSSLFGRLVEVPLDYRAAANELLQAPNALPTPRHAELQKMLIEQGMLVPHDFDELRHIVDQYRYAKFTPSSKLGLTICPTLACNFRCTYCFQAHPAGHMPTAVQDRLVEYVRSLMDLESLSVTWFGGEPLQALPVIENLSRQFRQGDYQYSANIITNASRLTHDASRRLVEIGVNWAQVTLDGPREIHDLRRPKVNGKGTFDEIITNLQGSDRRLALTIRVNVDRRNVEYIPRLFDQLDEAKLRGRVIVYFAPVAPYTEICADVVDHCVTGPDWARLDTQLTFLASERGYASPNLPNPRTNVCLADRAGDFVVVPSGLVFNCWNDVTDARRAVFDLKTMSRSAAMADELSKWTKWEPFAFEECRSCHVLPLCLGGCPSVGMRQNKGACGTLKYNLKDRILLHYLSAKKIERATALGEFLGGLTALGPPAEELRLAPTPSEPSEAQVALAKKVVDSLVSWTSSEHSSRDAEEHRADPAKCGSCSSGCGKRAGVELGP